MLIINTKHQNIPKIDLEFPIKVKAIPKFERINTLSISVFDLNQTVLIPNDNNTNYDQSRIDMLLFENLYCLISKSHTLIITDSLMNMYVEEV